ncbi:MAG: class I SAM-dependent methyltransferase [Planctomycetes bacterium]|nr:class I SAM-dependent methyltransferase [Planctomycetota bacterium]
MSPAASERVDVTTCQLCGSARREELFRDGPYTVCTCSDCGLVYVTPRLFGQALLDVYGASYWKSDNPKQRGYADYAKESALYLKTYRRRMRLVSRWLPAHARLLDVGCAAGYFLRVAQEHGHDVHGVELSEPIAEEAIAALGADRVFHGFLDDAVAARGWQPQSFDMVTIWDVIEHVPEPQQLLASIRRLLKPGGKLLLETQNVRSRFARLLGPRWHHFKHDEHIYHFSPATITRLLDDCGFRVRHLGAGFAGKYVSFGFLAERAGRLGRIPALLASPLGLLRGCNVYFNPHDELIVVAELKD